MPNPFRTHPEGVGTKNWEAFARFPPPQGVVWDVPDDCFLDGRDVYETSGEQLRDVVHESGSQLRFDVLFLRQIESRISLLQHEGPNFHIFAHPAASPSAYNSGS